MKKQPLHKYLWVASAVYLALGFVNILFAWLGMACFLIPLLISTFHGNKTYCHKYCGRGQLLDLLGRKCGLSRNRDIPPVLRSKAFRYGFLVFFMFMFFNMILTTYLVFSGAKDLSSVVTLLWTIRLPWQWAAGDTGIAPWITQYAFGFYSVMLTSTLLGLVTMVLYKPRSFCVYCPMGTMTQGICKLKHRKDEQLLLQ